MVKTLKDIVDEVVKTTDLGTLKTLKGTAETAKTAYDESVKNKEAEDVMGPKKKKAEDTQKEFDDKRTDFVGRISNAIRAEREKDNLDVYSKEVAERRKNRKKNDIEEEIKSAQGAIDILTLKIDAIDKEVEEVRKGLTPAKTT